MVRKSMIALMALFLSAFGAGMLPNARADIPTDEREALIQLYNATDGDNWQEKTGWLGDSGTECTWYGVTCDAEMSHVTGIDLSANGLSGSIPGELQNLTGLTSGGSDFRWNALSTTDNALQAFLSDRQVGGDWEATQTIPPTNLSVSESDLTSISLTWDAIPYTADSGGYAIEYSLTPGGPFKSFGTTAGKDMEEITVGHLMLATTYYFRIRTKTHDHANNPNIVYSEYTDEISGTTLDLIIDTVAGNRTSAYSGDDGNAVSAALTSCSGVTADSEGNLYIADAENHRIRKVDIVTGIITTVAGNGEAGYSGDDGSAVSASLNSPQDVAADADGNLFIADQNNHRIRRVDAGTGIITTFAGTGEEGDSGDSGAATDANLRTPSGVDIDDNGNLYISDQGNHRIRKVDAGTGMITTIAGNGTAGDSGDNDLATLASLNSPSDMAADPDGNIFIADTLNHRIRKVDTDGTITTIAGDGTLSDSGDRGPAESARLNLPKGIAVDSDPEEEYLHIYIADQGNHRIRKIYTDGIITTLAGDGSEGNSGDRGNASLSKLNSPANVVVADGSVYIADDGNHVIRKAYHADDTPAPPTDLSVSGTFSEVVLSWGTDFTGDMVYWVERKPEGGEYAWLGHTAPGVSNYTDKEPVPDKVCYYRLRAYQNGIYSDLGDPDNPDAPDDPGEPFTLPLPLCEDDCTGISIDREGVCSGQPANLLFTLRQGVGPFDVVYSDEETDYELNSISDGHAVPVSLASDVTYSLISITDAEGNKSYPESSVDTKISPDISGILGSPLVGPGSTKEYSVRYTEGSSYKWEVVGGDIVSTDNNQATVKWGDDGGTVSVTERETGGCRGTSTLLVSSYFEYTPWSIAGQICGKAKIGEDAAGTGDWVAAFDENGNCVGSNELVVSDGMAYIYMYIYNSDDTPVTVSELQLYDHSLGEKLDLQFGGEISDQPCPPDYGGNYVSYDFQKKQRGAGLNQRHSLRSGPFEFEPVREGGLFWGQALIRGKDGIVPAEAGDWVGAFGKDGKCVGGDEITIDNDTGIAYINLNIYEPPDNTFTLQLYDLSEDTFLECEIPEFDGWEATNGSPMSKYGDWTEEYRFLSYVALPEFELDEGWNLISFDVAPRSRKPADILEPLIVNDNFLYMSGFKESGVITHDPNGLPLMNTLTEIEDGYGYWIKTEREATLSVPGTLIDSVEPVIVDLYAGWNLVMYNEDEEKAPDVYFIDLISDDNLLYVTGFDIGYEIYDPSAPPFLNTLKRMKRGLGYWVKVEIGLPRNLDSPMPFEPNTLSGLFYGKATIEGELPELGDWILAFDPEGNCAGACPLMIGEDSAYFNLPIYGDDSDSDDIDEGMGDIDEYFTLKIYDASEDKYITSPRKFDGWSDTNGMPMKRYRDMNEVYDFHDIVSGDINSNGKVGVEDVILILKVLSGKTDADPVLDADPDGDLKLGLDDALYLLQMISENPG